MRLKLELADSNATNKNLTDVNDGFTTGVK
jgi:hypothetical protein